jgi:hypothetical protein
MRKRIDECLFCSSRTCRTRIVRPEEPHYDEVACNRHISELEKHSDVVLGRKNGVMRHHISSLGNLKRGENINNMLEVNENEN